MAGLSGLLSDRDGPLSRVPSELTPHALGVDPAPAEPELGCVQDGACRSHVPFSQPSVLLVNLMSHLPGCLGREEGLGICLCFRKRRSFQMAGLWVLGSHVLHGFKAATHLVRVLGPA